MVQIHILSLCGDLHAVGSGEGSVSIGRLKKIASGCGSVGKAFASDIKGPQFKLSHRQNLYCLLSNVLKSKNKEKRDREWHI